MDREMREMERMFQQAAAKVQVLEEENKALRTSLMDHILVIRGGVTIKLRDT